MSDSDRSFVLRTMVIVLAISSMSVVFALLAGLWVQNIDNGAIFEILKPLTQVITGALISTLSGLIAYKAGKSHV